MEGYGKRDVDRILRINGREAVKISASVILFENPVADRRSRMALAAAENAAKNIMPSARRQMRLGDFSPLTVEMSSEVMHKSPELISAFSDIYIDLKREGDIYLRDSWVLDLRSGAFLKNPYRLISGGKRAVAAAVLDAIDRSPESFYSDARITVLRKPFGWYLNDDGAVIYWPRGTIAPGNAGLPSFFVPFGKKSPLA